jgi:hypothetical protein
MDRDAMKKSDLVRTLVVCFGFVLMMATAALTADHSAVGTWKLNLQKSSFGSQPAPKFEQLVVATDAPDALKWNMKGVTSDGKSYMMSFDGPVDGDAHHMMSSMGEDNVAYTRTPSGVNWVVKDKDGKIMERASSQLSADGNTLTIIGVSEDSTGKNKFLAIYNREQ